MKRKVIWLSIAGITFIIGVASAMVWFQFPNLRGSNPQPPVESKPLRGSERMHVCLKRFDINLGDSFDYVNKVINLTPDPNGPNENISWQAGKLTDFFSASQFPIELDKDNRLNPSIFCVFDEQKKLKSFSISWTYEGQQSNSIKRKIIDTLIEREHFCMAGKKINLEESRFIKKVDVGDYVQEFGYDFSERLAFWRVSYSIAMK